MFYPLLALMMLGGAVLPAADNLLSNASFEARGADDDRAASWSRSGEWINRETDWTPVRTGECVLGYHHWQIEDDKPSQVWQDATVAAGATYRLSVFIRVDRGEDGSGAPPRAVELRLEAPAEGVEAKRVAVTTVDVAKLDPATTWTEAVVEGVAPGTTLRAVIAVLPAAGASRTGALSFDDAALRLKP